MIRRWQALPPHNQTHFCASECGRAGRRGQPCGADDLDSLQAVGGTTVFPDKMASVWDQYFNPRSPSGDKA
jgi:hypothetical protein